MLDKKLLLAASLGLATVAFTAAPVFAEEQEDEDLIPGEITGSVALTSDYSFRGISQTDKGPALQEASSTQSIPALPAPLPTPASGVRTSTSTTATRRTWRSTSCSACVVQSAIPASAGIWAAPTIPIRVRTKRTASTSTTTTGKSSPA